MAICSSYDSSSCRVSGSCCVRGACWTTSGTGLVSNLILGGTGGLGVMLLSSSNSSPKGFARAAPNCQPQPPVLAAGTGAGARDAGCSSCCISCVGSSGSASGTAGNSISLGFSLPSLSTIASKLVGDAGGSSAAGLDMPLFSCNSIISLFLFARYSLPNRRLSAAASSSPGPAIGILLKALADDPRLLPVATAAASRLACASRRIASSLLGVRPSKANASASRRDWGSRSGPRVRRSSAR